MVRGTNSREEVKRQILLLAEEGKDYSQSYFVHALKGRTARNTVLKYLDELVSEKSMNIHLPKNSLSTRAVYRISKQGVRKIELVRLNQEEQEFNSLVYDKDIVKMSPEEKIRAIRGLREAYRNVVEQLRRAAAPPDMENHIKEAMRVEFEDKLRELARQVQERDRRLVAVLRKYGVSGEELKAALG